MRSSTRAARDAEIQTVADSSSSSARTPCKLTESNAAPCLGAVWILDAHNEINVPDARPDVPGAGKLGDVLDALAVASVLEQ
ncbi:MAG: hypothetical protein U1E76_18125 [Planctomycetota bacterium]